MRRRDRRAQHRLVGGVGDARLVHQPLRGARRRRPALVLVELGRRAALRAHRRGRDARRLRARARRRGSCATCASTRRSAPSTATTSTSACRCARPAARSSPPTSGRSTTGRWRCSPTRRSGSTRTSASPRSGTAGCPRIGDAAGTWRERALRAEAERDAARARSRTRPRSRSRRATAMLEHALDETRDEHLVADHGAAAAVPARAARRRSADAAPLAAAAPMIAFACAVREPDAYRDHAGPGIERAAEPDSEVHAFAAVGLGLPRATTSSSTRPRDTTTSRRSCSSTRTPRSPTRDFCAKVRARAGRPGRRARRAAPARPASRAPPGGRASVSAGPGHPSLPASTAAASSTRSRGRAPRRRRPRSTRSAASCSCSRRGRRASLRFDEGLASAPASTSTSALQARAGGAEGRHRRPAGDPPPPAQARRGASTRGSRAHIELAEKWDGRLPGAPPRPADWKERARLAEAERDAARRRCLLELLAPRGAARSARARARGDDRRRSAGG